MSLPRAGRPRLRRTALARRIHDAHKAGRDNEAQELQEQLTGLRAEIEAFPLTPALKSITAHLTEEDGWRNLRPPLVGLEDGQAERLLDRLPLPELL